MYIKQKIWEIRNQISIDHIEICSLAAINY